MVFALQKFHDVASILVLLRHNVEEWGFCDRCVQPGMCRVLGESPHFILSSGRWCHVPYVGSQELRMGKLSNALKVIQRVASRASVSRLTQSLGLSDLDGNMEVVIATDLLVTLKARRNQFNTVSSSLSHPLDLMVSCMISCNF